MKILLKFCILGLLLISGYNHTHAEDNKNTININIPPELAKAEDQYKETLKTLDDKQKAYLTELNEMFSTTTLPRLELESAFNIITACTKTAPETYAPYEARLLD